MNPYLPRLARVENVFKEREDVVTLTIAEKPEFNAGQFVMVSAFGIGEAPFSIASSPLQKNSFEITVKNVGNVSNALHQTKKGDVIGVRGPYGNGWPIKEYRKKDLVLVAGGVGVVPIRSLIGYIMKRRREFKKVYIFYGAKSPEELLYKREIELWQKMKNSHVYISVDKPFPSWKGYVGMIHAVLEKAELKISRNAMAAICGPPIMIKYSVESLLRKGLKHKNIFISLERLMQCGIGTCGHCNINEVYVCKDGPVFCFEDVKGLKELW